MLNNFTKKQENRIINFLRESNRYNISPQDILYLLDLDNFSYDEFIILTSENLYKVLILDNICSLMKDIIEDSCEVGTWIKTKNDIFWNLKPIDLIKNDNYSKIYEMIFIRNPVTL